MEGKITIPADVERCCARLRGAGHRACPVGGCVRDRLLGREPGDWDVTTSAAPEEILALFPHARLTGGTHGTVTVVTECRAVEITPFRAESGCSDGRHPDYVTFGVSLEEDLARRDFTINAMALDEGGAVIDPFGGQADLERGLIRCVGDPAVRFSEDTLRILRALRFASVHTMAIEEQTAAAIHKKRDLLGLLPGERIYGELTRLLCGPNVEAVLLEYADVLAVPIPELTPAVGFDQRNPNHHLDVWGHTAAVAAAVPPDPVLRWAALLHDLGKPAAFTLDPEGVGHFYGHAVKSAALADVVMGRLRFDNATRQDVRFLVEHHDDRIRPTEQSVKRAVQQFGARRLERLLTLFRGDAVGHVSASARERLAICDGIEARLRSLTWMGERLTAKDLALKGADLLALGYCGPAVGAAQRLLLERVVEDPTCNTREELRNILDSWVKIGTH